MDNNLQLTETSLGYLNTTRKWTMFFTVLGFIGSGFLLLGGIAMIVMGVFTEEINGFTYWGFIGGIFYLILGAIMFYPIFHLLKFSNNAKKMCNYQMQEYVDTTFLNLKSYYKICGIMTIIILSLYIVSILLFLIGTLLRTVH